MSMVAHTAARGSLVAPIATGCCLAAAATYVAIQDPSEGGTFLPCPFRTATGLWCPGCGLTRATHHLLRGDLVTALRFNVFVIPIVVTIVVAWATWMLRTGGRTIPRRRLPAWTAAVAIAVVVGFAVVRNLPGVDGLRG
jgi:hypothetical protein